MQWLRRASAVAAIGAVGCTADRQDPVLPPVEPCAEHPCDVAAVVGQLGEAYRRRDYAHFSRLLHDDFLFILHPDPMTVPPLPESWNAQEELRIHRRMFDPQHIPTTESALDRGLWVMAVTINLTPSQPFEERPEFYRSASRRNGLDPNRWKAWGAAFDTAVLLDTSGEMDYQIDGRAWFVVAEDLAKPLGEPGRFTLYRWQDLGSRYTRTTSVEPPTWSQVKGLYRP